jgi:hypothetical protein
MVSSASYGVGCDVESFGWNRFSSGRKVGRLSHITAMANSTELQLAMPTRVHVGFALSMEKREYTRMTLMTQTLVAVSETQIDYSRGEDHNIPRAKLKTSASFDFWPSLKPQICLIGIHRTKMFVRMLGIAWPRYHARLLIQ